MGRRIYWLEYPEKNESGEINNLQKIVDWAYDNSIGERHTLALPVGYEKFSIDFEDEVILDSYEDAQEYILNDLYPEYSGFDPRAYDLYNFAVRFRYDSYEGVSFNKEFHSFEKHKKYLLELKKVFKEFFESILSDKKAMFKLSSLIYNKCGINFTDAFSCIENLFNAIIDNKPCDRSVYKALSDYMPMNLDGFVETLERYYPELLFGIPTNRSNTYEGILKLGTIFEIALEIGKYLKFLNKPNEKEELHWLIRIEEKG